MQGGFDNVKTFFDVPVGGSYTVSEAPTNGWVLTDVRCESAASTTTTDPDNGLAVIENLVEGDTVTCTFYNKIAPSMSTCNIFEVDLVGRGMGSTRRARQMVKVPIPQAGSATSVYGQMAARTFQGVRYVRFIYPDRSYEQVQPATNLGVDKAISWWGSYIDETNFDKPWIKARWFWTRAPAS